MKITTAKLVAIGLGSIAMPTLSAIGIGHAATFSVGATVVDVCQVPDAYRTYTASPPRRRDPRCADPNAKIDADVEPVTIVTRASNGEVTALSLEF